MSGVSPNSGAAGKRAFSLYGVTPDDRVAASMHFAAADMHEALHQPRMIAGGIAADQKHQISSLDVV